LAAAGAVVLATGGLSLAGASSAAADQVWHQSVSRASAATACSTSSADELAAGWWSQWAPSWEQWANGGKGGFTCARSITWAFDSPADAPTDATVLVGVCMLLEEATDSDPDLFVLVDPSGFIPDGAPYFDNENCAPPESDFLGLPYGAAVTSGGEAAAIAICRAGNPGGGLVSAFFISGLLWRCEEPVLEPA
jgi:hypothetical protein